MLDNIKGFHKSDTFIVNDEMSNKSNKIIVLIKK